MMKNYKEGVVIIIMKPLHTLGICGILLLVPQVGYTATAVTVPATARSVADSLQNDAERVLLQRKAIEQMQQYLQETQVVINSLEKSLQENLILLTQAEEKLKNESIVQQTYEDRLNEYSKAEQLLALKTKNMDLANAAMDQAYSNAKRMQTDNADRTYRLAEERARMAVEEAEQAWIYFQEIDKTFITVQQQHMEIIAVKNEAEGLREAIRSNEEGLAYYRNGYSDVVKALADMTSPGNLSSRDWNSYNTAIKSYNWTDKSGNTGYQLYQPHTYGLVKGHMEYSLSSGYVVGNNSAFDDGRVSHWLDTTLAVAYAEQKKRYLLTYMLNMNLPTGKESLPGTDAVVSDDLVENSRFGEGFNISPGIKASWNIGYEDSWTVAINYNLNGDYRPDSRVSDYKLRPGNAWSSVVDWRHVGENYQLASEFIFTTHTKTIDNTMPYLQGDQIEAHFTFNKPLTSTQNMMLYYWYAYDGAYTSSHPNFVAGSSRDSHFFGAMWSNQITPKQRIKLMADFMKRSGEGVDLLTKLNYTDRTKSSIGIGYDYEINSNSKVEFILETFSMNDKGKNYPINKYHGTNIYVNYINYW